MADSFLAHFRDGDDDGDKNRDPFWGANGATGTPPVGFENAVIAAETDKVRRATQGTRNHTLNQAAFNLAQVMSPDLWHAQLLQAAHDCGLDTTEAERTIESGIKGGTSKPRARHRMPNGRPPGHITELPSLDAYQDPAQRSPWAHIDPEQAQADQQHPPAFLARQDGTQLFYPGKVNGLIGESESGKTWVALLAVQQALDAGRAVLYLDFEDTYSGITGRLTSMGANLDRFYYTAPDVALTEEHRAALKADIEEIQPALIIIDGFNAAMTLLGLDLNSNTDATIFAQQLLRPLSKTGAAVAYVDHLPKNREGQFKGGIGAQAKRAMTTGCAIRVDVEQEFGKGQTGRLKLTVDKDRPGLVRAIAAGGKHLGHAVLESSPLGDAVSMHIDPEGGSKPTVIMGRVLDYLAIVGEATKTQIKDNVEGNNDIVWKAIDVLHKEGKLDIRPGKNRSLIVSTPVVPSYETSSRDDRPIVPPRIKGGTMTDPDDHDQEEWWKR